MATKHIPERTCIGCKSKKAKTVLLRFVYLPAPAEIAFDPRKKLPGRGAYLCPDEECLQLAMRQKGLDRSYRAKVAPEIYRRFATIFREITRHEK